MVFKGPRIHGAKSKMGFNGIFMQTMQGINGADQNAEHKTEHQTDKAVMPYR